MSSEEVLRGFAGGIICVLGDRKVLRFIENLFGRDARAIVEKLGNPLICSGEFTELYLVSDLLASAAAVLFRKNYVPYSAGLYAGRLRKRPPRFIPSANLLQLIYDALGPRRAVEVSEEGIKPFLYGNDILKKSVLKCYEPVSRSEVVGIIGSDGYVYGVGLSNLQSCKELASLSDLDEVAQNVFDIGWYLRGGTKPREKKYKID
ncbi:MAG: hypothetical protein J7J11_00350 [Desulfurococcales archaeon]|nr:hypothetical protein [Desulfurococcales archaeon]